MLKLLIAALCTLVPTFILASEGHLDMTTHWIGITCVAVFVLAYALVMVEEFTHLRKSKPVIVAAGIIWALVAVAFIQAGNEHGAEEAVRHALVEYSELFLFLLAAMTYVNSMTERGVFDALRSWLVRKGYGFRKLFWITGILAFFLSPIIDNLTTALVMCAVVMSVGKGNKQFIGLACINIVVAANAGGAFSPFGDITTLMVWQAGILPFFEFFSLFTPSVVNFIVPAALMVMAVPNEQPTASGEVVHMRRGGLIVVGLFGLTLVTAVSFHQFLHLPPFLGMMTGLGYLKIFGYYLKRTHVAASLSAESDDYGTVGDVAPFDVFRQVARAEWDTLLFFYGVILCVGGLGQLGYLAVTSHLLYIELGPTWANISVGILSAIVDNIPVMVAVLQMEPQMNLAQWELVTLTAGVGGSLLSIGSAAGVALMGQARGNYTFFGHLKWSWAIGLGYVLSILVHLWMTGEL